MGLAKQITRNGLYRALFLLFQFLNTILISRLSGPAGLGLFSLMIVNANLLTLVTSLGIPSGMLYHASVRDVTPGSLLRIGWMSTVLQVTVVVIFEALQFRARGSFFIWNDPEISAGLSGILLFLSVVAIEKYHVLYNGYGKLLQFNRITALFNFLLFIAMLFIYTCETADKFRVLMILYVLAQLAQLIVLALLFRSGEESTLKGSKAGFSLVSYSLQAYAANLLFFLLTRVDFWILEYYHGENELGIYALAVRLIQIMLILPAFLSTVVLPGIASRSLDAHGVHRIFRLLNTVKVMLLLLILLSCYWAIPFFFGKEFQASAWILVLLMPGILFISAQTFLASYFAARKQVNVNVTSVLVALAVAIAGDLLVIPGYGAQGAAVVSSISYVVCFVYPYIVYTRQEGFSWGSLFLNKKDRAWIIPLLQKIRGDHDQ